MLLGLTAVLLAVLTALPLAWKWQLGTRRVGLVVAGLGVLAFLALTPASLPPVARAALVWLLALAAAVAILLYRFYRDPRRTPPDRADVIVSPADGEVVYVRRAERGRMPVSTKHGRDYLLEELTKTPLRSDDAVVIGISMSFLDVHVNRAPIDGRVTLQRHFPGLFGSLRRPEMVFDNERATTVIEREDLQVAVVQIASRLVRQIVAHVREGEVVQLGQSIGVIRLGSQVDLVLPVREDLQVSVQAGDRLTAGESIVAVLNAAVPGEAGEAPGPTEETRGAERRSPALNS